VNTGHVSIKKLIFFKYLTRKICKTDKNCLWWPLFENLFRKRESLSCTLGRGKNEPDDGGRQKRPDDRWRMTDDGNYPIPYHLGERGETARRTAETAG
jgi:hypothetical protein